MARRDTRSREDSLAAEMLGHHDQLVRLAQQVLGDGHLAEDAVGNAYLRAWRSRKQLSQPEKLLPWLRTICRREAFRIGQQSQQRWLATETGGPGCSIAAEGPQEADRLAAEELLSRLPVKLHRCAWMHFVEGRSPKQIAGALGLPVTTVRGRLRLALDRLRKENIMHPRQDTAGAERRCADGRLVWGKLSIRFLGACRTGGRALYDATGTRLSRLPVTVQRTKAVPPSSDRPFGPDPWTGPLVWAFWEVAGPEVERRNLQMSTRASYTSTGAACLPAGHGEPRSAGRKKLLTFYFGLPEGARSVRLRSELLGAEDRSSGHVVRWDFGFDRGLDTWICGGRPGWGATCALPARPARTAGHSRVNVIFSSVVVKTACRVFGLDRARKEVAPVLEVSCEASEPEGHLRVEEVELPFPPDELFGVVLYPRHSISVDWGRIVIPQ